MVDVLVDDITPRLIYTFDFIFKDRGISYNLEKDISKFLRSENPKFNYSARYTDGVEHIEPCSLLFEDTIENPTLSLGDYKNVSCLSFDHQIDVVASVFYTISRYEEYTSKLTDEHGRFKFKGSVADQYCWIEHAVVDRWCFSIFEALELNIPQNTPKLIPTFDIDNAFAYKFKSKKRTLFSILKDFLTFRIDRIKERKKVFSGKLKDPFDTFDVIKSTCSKFDNSKVFWLNRSNDKYDRNVPISNVTDLIKELSELTSLGIHPSYSSFLNKDKLKAELRLLEQEASSRVEISRQHFLRFRLPESYQLLIDIGITNDFSMGFADHIGFRAGTARSFKWFDLVNNKPTDLLITPFVYMDGSLLDYMDLDIESSKERIKTLYNEVKVYGGDFVFLWHNETIGDYARWAGWSSVFDFTLNLKNE